MHETQTDNIYQVIIDTPDEHLHELFDKAQYPEQIATADVLPAFSDKVVMQPRSKFEKSEDILFSNIHIPLFLKENFYRTNQQDCSREAAKLTISYHNLIIANMSSGLGKGLFAKTTLSPETYIPYGGKFVDVKSNQSEYKITYADRTQAQDAKRFRHFGAYAQHAPTHIPEQIEFLITQLKDVVACANAQIAAFPIGNQSITCLKLTRAVAANEGIYHDYGDNFWQGRLLSPRLLDRYGRAIPRSLYLHDRIFIQEAGSKMIHLVDRSLVLKHLKTNTSADFTFYSIHSVTFFPTVHSIPYTTLKKFCEEKGYIPLGEYFRALLAKTDKIIDWERELRQAAHDGRVDDLEYILEWLPNEQSININAAGQQTGKTALHNAVEQGHIYAFYYLMLNNADLTIKDKNKNTVIDIINKKLASVTPNQSQALRTDYEHMQTYLNNLSKQTKIKLI